MNEYELPPGFVLDTEPDTRPAANAPRAPVEQRRAPVAQSSAAQEPQTIEDTPERPRSVWDQPRQMQDNRQVADTSLGDVFDGEQGYNVKNDPERLAVGQQVGKMLVNGASDEAVLEYLSSKGVTNVANMQEIFAYRKTPEFAEWKRQNPGVIYPLDDTFDDIHVPISTGGEALAYLAGSSGGAAAVGVADGLTFGTSDEIAGAVGGAVDTIRDGGNFSDNYDRNVENYRHGQETVQANNPYSYIGGNIVGSVASAIPVARGIGTAGQIGAKALAKEGAVVGALHGAGDAEGGVMNRALGAIEGAATGAAFGAAGGAVASKFARAGERSQATTETLDTIRDMNTRYGLEGAEAVRPLPAQVGGTGTRVTQGASNSTIAGAVAIGRANEKFATNSGKLLDRMAGATDDAILSTEDAARQISRGGSETNLASLPSRLDTRVEGLYTRAFNEAGDVQLTAPKTVDVLDQEIDRLLARPGKVSNLDDLVDFRDSLKNGTFSVQTLREERTAFGRLLDNADSGQRTIAKRVWGSLTDDIADGLNSKGLNDATRSFRRADAAYSRARGHTELVDDILKGSEEDIGKRLAAMSRGDGKRLRDTMRLMDDGDARAVRQSVIQGLGRKGDDEFSPATFITNWKKLSQGGKAALFQGQHRSDINAFVDLMERANKSYQFANTSGTAMPVMAISMLRQFFGNAGSAIGGMAVTGSAGGAVAGVVGSVAIAALLSSPKMARFMVWLGKSGNTRAQITTRLTQLATRNPDLVEQIGVLQNALNAVPEEERMAPPEEEYVEEDYDEYVDDALPEGLEVIEDSNEYVDEELPEGFVLDE